MGGNGVHTAFLILIIVVLSASLLFGLVIWYQTIKFQKKAAAAKVRQEEYMQLLRLQKEEEKAAAEALAQKDAAPEGTESQEEDAQTE